jgi:hypothetical protein
VWGRIHADEACYVRLPDAPGARYGAFGGYNDETGVLIFAGGAEKRTEENTIAFHDLYGIKLDSADADWSAIPYSSNVGYTSDATDKGCREMTTVQLPDSGGKTRSLSVWGKDGCDNGAFDPSSKKGGDIKEISIGDSASRTGVAWVPNSGAAELSGELLDNKGKLFRSFAAYDTTRGRLVFGQGTFDEDKDALTQDEIYAARPYGSRWQISQMRPDGPTPMRRYGTCAAYIVDPGQENVDGMLVLGGQQGGTVDPTSYKEVWWLDFSAGDNGTWRDITALFGNMDAFGFRREGACAYNPATKQFYSWMGRADSKIPDGASHSTGVWRADLSQLGDALKGNGQLTWERLAKDNQPGLEGRRLIPSVVDWANNRFFAMGGRKGIDEYSDMWAIYPDVTGAACDDLEPWTIPNIPTSTPPPVVPTNTPPGSGTPNPTNQPPPTVAPDADVCAFILSRVPSAIINNALANPDTVYGWGQLCYPNRPTGPTNGLRDKLSLRNPSAPYHPVFNGVVWKCGCP